MSPPLTRREGINKIIGAVLAVAALCGLHFSVEYAGWVLFVGLVLVL